MKHVYRCLSLDTGWTHCTNGRSRSKIPACAKTLRSFTSTGMELLLGKTPKTVPHYNLYFSRFCISAKIFQNLRSLFCVLFLLWYCVVLLRHPPVGWVKGCHQIPSRTCISIRRFICHCCRNKGYNMLLSWQVPNTADLFVVFAFRI